ncbi:MAG: hypothetical protein M1522_08765 [Actinobacteria bacterium]|nr:hypothetical protein [Actinomycetota bacterium]
MAEVRRDNLHPCVLGACGPAGEIVNLDVVIEDHDLPANGEVVLVEWLVPDCLADIASDGPPTDNSHHDHTGSGPQVFQAVRVMAEAVPEDAEEHLDQGDLESGECGMG